MKKANITTGYNLSMVAVARVIPNVKYIFFSNKRYNNYIGVVLNEIHRQDNPIFQENKINLHTNLVFKPYIIKNLKIS